MFKKGIFFILTILAFFLTTKNSFATITTCDKSQCNPDSDLDVYEQCLKDVRDICLKQRNTYSSQLEAIDSQYQLALVKITQTENSINNLKKEIAEIDVQLNKLGIEIDELSLKYINQTIQNYKIQKENSSFLYVFSKNLNNYLEQRQYVINIQKNIYENLVNREQKRQEREKLKEEKQNKQSKLEEEQKTLASQKINLVNQKAIKNDLLKVTEEEYNRVQNEITALRKFSSGAGGSACLSYSPAKEKEGEYKDYYSQRDTRWCDYPINPNSLCNGSICDNDKDDDIGHIGCAITSYAIVLSKKGINITPEEISSNKGNFCDGNGNCYSYYKKLLINKLKNDERGYNTSVIDSELLQGHYVILELSAFGGTHFVVIISGNNGNYKIHDPWYGANINLNEKYPYNKRISIRLMW